VSADAVVQVGSAPAGVRAWERVERWFLAPQPIDALVLARIVFGAVLFFCYLDRAADVQFLYGPRGLAGPYWIHPGLAAPAWADRLAALAPAPSAGLVWTLYALGLIASLCFALGFRTRTAGVVALLVHLVFVRLRLPSAYWGWSLQIIPLVLFVVLSRAGRFASVDAWLAQRRGVVTPASDWVGPAWPLRLIQLHTCTMYLVSGGERLDDLGWLEGAAIWYAMSNTLYSKWAFDWHDFRLPMALGSWYTYMFEPVSALGLWLPRVGPILAYMAIAMHVGLELLTNVGWWNFVMGASLLAFLPAAHVRALAARLPGAGALRAVAAPAETR
jgi:hypothetical protein